MLLTLGIAAAGTVIGSQLVKLASSMPEYEETIRDKLATMRELGNTQFDSLTSHAGKVMNELNKSPTDNRTQQDKMQNAVNNNPEAPVLVEIQEPALRPLQLLQKIMASVWPPIEMAGIVLMVLIFVLMEHESLRDRLIRLIGSNDLRATTIAVMMRASVYHDSLSRNLRLILQLASWSLPVYGRSAYPMRFCLEHWRGYYVLYLTSASG